MNALKNNYIFPAIFILLLCVNFSFAQHEPAHKKLKKHKATHHPVTPHTSSEPHHPSQHELHNVAVENIPKQRSEPAPTEKTLVPGFNLKFSPAFFWKTIGVEAEYIVNSRFSVGLNVYGKWGVTRPEKTNETTKYNFLQDGLRTELAFKYYLMKKAPEGIYLQANIAYSQLNYFNGSAMPYTLLNMGLPSGEIGIKPKPYGGGLGVGYQLVVIPKLIIANIMLGMQANVAGDNKIFMSLYAAPSIGVIF
jgi:hypothetical protein